jgi:hypothetical protein
MRQVMQAKRVPTMTVDRFGNPHAPNLLYARGKILRSTEDDFQKLQLAWSLIRQRGPLNIYISTGLEHAMPLAPDDRQFLDDEIDRPSPLTG